MLRRGRLALLLVVTASCFLCTVSAFAGTIVIGGSVGDVSLTVYTYSLSGDLVITRVVPMSSGFAIYTQSGGLAKIRVFAPKSLRDIVIENAVEALSELAFDPATSLRDAGKAIAGLVKGIAEDVIEQERQLYSYGRSPSSPHAPLLATGSCSVGRRSREVRTSRPLLLRTHRSRTTIPRSLRRALGTASIPRIGSRGRRCSRTEQTCRPTNSRAEGLRAGRPQGGRPVRRIASPVPGRIARPRSLSIKTDDRVSAGEIAPHTRPTPSDARRPTGPIAQQRTGRTRHACGHASIQARPTDVPCAARSQRRPAPSKDRPAAPDGNRAKRPETEKTTLLEEPRSCLLVAAAGRRVLIGGDSDPDAVCASLREAAVAGIHPSHQTRRCLHPGAGYVAEQGALAATCDSAADAGPAATGLIWVGYALRLTVD